MTDSQNKWAEQKYNSDSNWLFAKTNGQNKNKIQIVNDCLPKQMDKTKIQIVNDCLPKQMDKTQFVSCHRQ